MVDMEIDGKTYTADALCVYRRDDDSGDWQATLHGYHHAVAHTPRMAVLRLASYLRDLNVDAFYKDKHHFDQFMKRFTEKETS